MSISDNPPAVLPLTNQRRVVRGLALLLLFLLLALYFYSFRSTYIDDAFIQLQFAKTLVNHGEWGFYPGYPVNTATSPLNVIVTGLFILITGDAILASVWFAAVQFVVLFWTLWKICERLFGKGYFAAFPFLAVLTNPLLLSTLGQETTLFVTLLLLCLHLYLDQRLDLLAIAAALLTLTRADGFLFFACLLFAIRGGRLRFFLVYTVTLLPWHVWSWIYLGSLVPDTLIIKTRQRMWEQGIWFLQGYWSYYILRFPLAAVWSVFLTPFALLSIRSTSTDVKKACGLLILFGLLHYAAYSLLVVPPYHWYYGPAAFCGTVAGSFGILSAVHRTKYAPAWTAINTIAIAAGILLLMGREGFPLQEAPIHTNGGTHQTYRQIGLWIRENTPPGSRFALMGEIGTIGYYSERVILSNFTFATYVNNARKKHRWMQNRVLRPLLEWNFYWRPESSTVGRRNYLLRHVAYAHTPLKDDRIIRIWDTSTKWFPEGRLYLERIGKKRN